MAKRKASRIAAASPEASYNCETIRTIIIRATDLLSARDGLLLKDDLNERSIAHKLAHYLEDGFPGWDVDCEYNRNHDDAKTLPLKRRDVPNDDLHARTVFPDVIVHRRNTDSNLLVIEIKKSTNAESSDWDKQKLKAFRGTLKYRFAVFLRLATGSNSAGKDPEIEFIN